MSDDPAPPLAGEWVRRLSAAADFLRRRIAGEYETDPDTGFDPELNRAVLMPAARALYRGWFRVRMRGLEHVPADGGALVVANHSGVLPIDALMLQVGIGDEHPGHRNLRLLGADMVYSVPLLGWLARASGHVPAHPDEADHLLRAGELVGVFPEGFKGIGKPFSDRYQLQRFGRGGFVRTALRNRVPMIPCAIVGAEEIYPMVADWRELAARLRLPYFPITPLFPWFGPLGAIPLPSNWLIEFCDPVPTDGFTPDQSEDDDVVAELAGKVKDTIAGKISELLAERGPAFGERLAIDPPGPGRDARDPQEPQDRVE
ncbi:MAG TPA: lysophospholipid acyltransferase family protein [Streptosporangiaceae bacterium]